MRPPTRWWTRPSSLPPASCTILPSRVRARHDGGPVASGRGPSPPRQAATVVDQLRSASRARGAGRASAAAGDDLRGTHRPAAGLPTDILGVADPAAGRGLLAEAFAEPHGPRGSRCFLAPPRLRAALALCRPAPAFAPGDDARTPHPWPCPAPSGGRRPVRAGATAAHIPWIWPPPATSPFVALVDSRLGFELSAAMKLRPRRAFPPASFSWALRFRHLLPLHSPSIPPPAPWPAIPRGGRI